jgi:hypothetical protein
MAIRTELTLRLPNSPGALADVCATLAAERVRLLALQLEANGTLRLVVDNPVRAAGTLRERRHTVTETDVMVTAVSNAHGALAATLGLLRDAGANVEYAYAAASSDSSDTTFLVLGVDDALRASTASGL